MSYFLPTIRNLTKNYVIFQFLTTLHPHIPLFSMKITKIDTQLHRIGLIEARTDYQDKISVNPKN